MVWNDSISLDTQICPDNITNHVSKKSGFTLVAVYICVISLNALILFVIFGVKHRSLRWSLDYLVSFLAITDLVSTLVGVPLPIIAYLQGYWPGSCSSDARVQFSLFNVSCKVFFLFLTWGRLSTMFIITMMCMDRFLAITKPFIHREIVTAGRLRKCVYVIWSIMFIYSILPLLNVGHVDLHWNKHLDNELSTEPAYFFCFIDYSKTELGEAHGIDNLIYMIVFLLFGFITLVIVLTCVFFICRILLIRRPQMNKLSKKTKGHQTASNTYSLNNSNVSEVIKKPLPKPSMLQKSRTFIAKRRPTIKKFEPEELQFISTMLIIVTIFYCTFLPTMVLVLCNILKIQLKDAFTFWAMRLTSFVVIANPLVYGLSNKLYRIGCTWVFRSIFNAFCCKKIPVPERLGPRRLSTMSYNHSHAPLNNSEKLAQDFIIAASKEKNVAIAKTFAGKIRNRGETSGLAGELCDEVIPEEHSTYVTRNGIVAADTVFTNSRVVHVAPDSADLPSTPCDEPFLNNSCTISVPGFVSDDCNHTDTSSTGSVRCGGISQCCDIVDTDGGMEHGVITT